MDMRSLWMPSLLWLGTLTAQAAPVRLNLLPAPFHGAGRAIAQANPNLPGVWLFGDRTHWLNQGGAAKYPGPTTVTLPAAVYFDFGEAILKLNPALTRIDVRFDTTPPALVGVTVDGAAGPSRETLHRLLGEAIQRVLDAGGTGVLGAAEQWQEITLGHCHTAVVADDPKTVTATE